MDNDRLIELSSYSPAFLANLAGFYHRRALTLHRDGALTLTGAAADRGVRQAWIACGTYGVTPEAVLTLEAAISAAQ